MGEWNPAWWSLRLEYDPFGDEILDGPRWTITYTFEREVGGPRETRIFPGLTAEEREALVGEKWQWLGGDPDLL